jgi:erythromycin esterase-like protein
VAWLREWNDGRGDADRVGFYGLDPERASHYFNAGLPEQFDVVIHFDQTRAVTPLEHTGDWEVGEAPETYPWAV